MVNGLDAHCPRSGAPLSDERVYPFQDGSKLAYSESEWYSRGGGQLTNGDRVSSQQALTRLVTRWQSQHFDSPNKKLSQAAALAVRRLKRTPEKNWNVYVWHALYERLDRKGFDVEWMLDHVEHVCPHCHSDLVWEPTPSGPRPRCQQKCSGGGYVHEDIANAIISLYNRAFDDTLQEYKVLR